MTKLSVTTYTLFLYHVNPYESKNFTTTEAKLCRKMAKFFDLITFDLWRIEEAKAITAILKKAKEAKEAEKARKEAETAEKAPKTRINVLCCNPNQFCYEDKNEDGVGEHEELKLGFQFLADMINRLFFIVIMICEIIAFSVTILGTVGSQSDVARLTVIKALEASSTSDPDNGLQMTNDFQSFVPYGK